MENDIQAVSDNEAATEIRPVAKTDSSLAVGITLVALLLWFGFQSVQLLRERGNLSAAKASQESAIQASEKVRLQFQGLVSKIAELANQGHGGARMIIDELQKRGIGVPIGDKTVDKPEPKPAK